MEIRLPEDHLVVPDLAGWRAARCPDLPDAYPLTLMPDWCCDVLSASTGDDDKAAKLPLYARAKVRWIWFVDPERRILEAYETLDGTSSLRLTAKGDDAIEIPPFDAPTSLAGWWI